MARFAVGQAIRSVEPTIVVDAGLPAGAHRFQLEVIDSTGRRSAPAVAVVTITEKTNQKRNTKHKTGAKARKQLNQNKIGPENRCNKTIFKFSRF